MSDRIAEAERLLATLIGARDRVKDLAEGRTRPDDGAAVSSPSPVQATTDAPAAPLVMEEHSVPPQTPSEDAPLTPTVSVEPMDLPDTDTGPPSPPEDELELEPEETLVLGLELESSPSAEEENQALDDSDTDPFGFLDQAPPDDPPSEPSTEPTPTAEETGSVDVEDEISHEPPPRRPAPLPAHPALAIGAPPLIRAPRAVEPRLRNPDAPHLDVDFLPPDPVHPEQEVVVEVDVPQLTEGLGAPTVQESTKTPAGPYGEVAFDGRILAEQALQGGDLQSAVLHFGDVLDFEPEDVQARLYRGRCHRDLGDHAAAMSDFYRAQDHAPHSPEPWVEMGDLFFARKDYSRAIVLYNAAIEISPNHAMAHCRRGISHHYRRRPDQAFDDLRAAQQLDPTIPNIDRYVQMATKPRR